MTITVSFLFHYDRCHLSLSFFLYFILFHFTKNFFRHPSHSQSYRLVRWLMSKASYNRRCAAVQPRSTAEVQRLSDPPASERWEKTELSPLNNGKFTAKPVSALDDILSFPQTDHPIGSNYRLCRMCLHIARPSFCLPAAAGPAVPSRCIMWARCLPHVCLRLIINSLARSLAGPPFSLSLLFGHEAPRLPGCAASSWTWAKSQMN